MPKSKSQTATGGTEVRVTTDKVKIAQAPEAVEEEPQDEGMGEAVGEGGMSPEQQSVNEAMIETVVKVLGKMLVAVTKIPEMDFDESETEQLKNLWSPLMPTMSPVAMAAIGTTVIVGGKLGIYMSKRQPKQLPRYDEAPRPKTTEEQLQEDWNRERADQ